jgi:O-antigen ligase
MNLNLPFDLRPFGSREIARAAPFAEEPDLRPELGQRLRRFLIVAIVATVPLNSVSGDKGAAAAVNLSLADAFLPLGVLFLAWLLMKGRLRLPMLLLCLLNISTVALSILLNLEGSVVGRGALAIGLEIAKLGCLWLLFYLFVNCIQSRSDFCLLMKAWILGSVAESLCGIVGSLLYQMAGIETPLALQFRAEGTMGDSNIFAAHLGAAFFLTFVYRRLVQPARPWTFFAMAVQLAGIYFSASRGGLLSLVATLLFLWLFATSGKQRIAGALVGLGVAILIASMPSQDAFVASNPMTERLKTTTVSLNDPEAQQRARLWRVAFAGFLSSPIIGIGRGNYVSLESTDPDGAGHAHNTLLGILCDTGLLGLAGYVAFGLAVILGLVRDWLGHPNRERRIVDGILLGVLLTVGLSGMTINIENYRGLWILLAVVVAYQRIYLAPVSAKFAKVPAVAVARISQFGFPR